MCRSPLGFLPWLAALFLFPITLMAQFGGISGSASAPGQGLTLGNVSTVNGLQSRMSGVMAHKYLAGRVYSPKGEPVANALVEITTNVGCELIPQLRLILLQAQLIHEFLFLRAWIAVFPWGRSLLAASFVTNPREV